MPAGYWHYGTDTSLGSPFYREHFEALVHGIADSIIAAHHDLRPGHIRVAEGEVEGGGFQRSRAAYLQNPEPERQLYATDVDNQMTLLSFMVDGQPVGLLNWHAVHPTSMSFYNKLISSDNKGYAAYAVEKKHNPSHDAPPTAISTSQNASWPPLRKAIAATSRPTPSCNAKGQAKTTSTAHGSSAAG